MSDEFPILTAAVGAAVGSAGSILLQLLNWRHDEHKKDTRLEKFNRLLDYWERSYRLRTAVAPDSELEEIKSVFFKNTSDLFEEIRLINIEEDSGFRKRNFFELILFLDIPSDTTILITLKLTYYVVVICNIYSLVSIALLVNDPANFKKFGIEILFFIFLLSVSLTFMYLFGSHLRSKYINPSRAS